MIRGLLRERAGQDRPVILKEDRNVTYGEASERAAELQAALPACPQKTVGMIFMPDGEKFLAGLFALLQEGWTAFPVSSNVTENELADMMKQADAKAVLTCEALKPVCEKALRLGDFDTASPESSPAVICEEEVKFFPKKVSASETLADGYPELKAVCGDEPMLLLASSGTTGKPKLVRLSENNIEFNVKANLNHMGYEVYGEASPRYALGTPFSAVYGLMMIFSCVKEGFPMLPMSEGFTLEHFYRDTEKYRISHYDGGATVAAMMDKTLKKTIPYDISSLKYLGFGGSKAPRGALKRLSEAFPGVRFWEGYGMTEAGPLIAQPLKILPADKSESVGLPLPGTEVLISADGDDGKGERLTKEPYIRGEITVRGPNVMLGYRGEPQDAEGTIRSGRLYTGDIGYFDEDGYLYICGRRKNMLIVRGFNVYPEEIEKSLLSCPYVRDCSVYGIFDEEDEEKVGADVIPAAHGTSKEDIEKWCAEHFSPHKRPSKINLTEKIEKTSTGKNRRPVSAEADASGKTREMARDIARDMARDRGRLEDRR